MVRQRRRPISLAAVRSLHNAVQHAVVKKRLAANPLNDPKVNWERPSDMDVDHEVDPRCVGNPKQVAQLLVFVSYVGRLQGMRFVAFFACIFYGMLRPEEVVGLRVQNYHLPKKGWGRLTLEEAQPAPGKAWTDSGEVHDNRGLKHRSRKSVRPVPIPPELVQVLGWHIDMFGIGPDGRIFRSVNGNPISLSTYNRVWSRTRELGLLPEQVGSLLLKRPYDLRHSGITVRLYAGVPVKQVAQWAGNSEEVLHRTYSKILDGFDAQWETRISEVLGTLLADDEEPDG
jgi:integrase